MGVGVTTTLFFIVMVSTSCSVVMMTTPHDAFAWQEKLEEELERLNNEYFNENEDVVDFQEIRREKIAELKKELAEVNVKLAQLSTEMALVEEEIKVEMKLIEKQQEEINRNWNAPQVDKSMLREKWVEKNEIQQKHQKTSVQRDEIQEKIKNKELLLEIQKHGAKLVGIELSPNCVKLVKLGADTCPTYEDLLSLDTSNREMSGDFSFHEGYFHREKSRYVDSWRFYDTEDVIRVIVDPHFELKQRIKMITLEPNMSFYALESDRYVKDGNVTIHKDRFIKDCTNATVNAEKYLEAIPDTIFTFRNGCTETNFDETYTYSLPKSEVNLEESAAYQYMKWLERTMQKCKVLC